MDVTQQRNKPVYYHSIRQRNQSTTGDEVGRLLHSPCGLLQVGFDPGLRGDDRQERPDHARQEGHALSQGLCMNSSRQQMVALLVCNRT